MEVKENRPDACAASGTANSIYKDFSTDAPDIQEELTGPVLPDECAADIVSFCSEQTIAYDDLLEYATLFYLQDKDPEDPPFRDTLKFELLTLTNRCIDAYNFGKRDPNAAPGAKLKDAYPDKKEGAERYGPRVHDLRHTFAVRSMQKLKKSKSDIVTTLPYLSAYLGHCNMSATQIYLHLTAECYPEFIQKQCDYLVDTIPTWEAPNENC